MALEAIVDSLDGIPEGIRGEYKPIENGDHAGKFMLDVNAQHGFGLENVGGLKSSLTQATADLHAAKDAVKGYSGIKLKPSEIADKLKRLETLEKLDPEKESDRLAATKLDTFKTSLTSEFEGKLSTEKGRADRLQGQVSKLLVDNALQSAIVKHGGIPELLLPILANRVKVREDEATGQLSTHVLDDAGRTDMTVDDGKVRESTIEDLVTKFKADKTYGRAFEASGKSGSGAPANGGRGGGNAGAVTLSQKEWLEKTSRAKPDERKQMFQELAAGKYVVTE